MCLPSHLVPTETPISALSQPQGGPPRLQSPELSSTLGTVSPWPGWHIWMLQDWPKVDSGDQCGVPPTPSQPLPGSCASCSCPPGPGWHRLLVSPTRRALPWSLSWFGVFPSWGGASYPVRPLSPKWSLGTVSPGGSWWFSLSPTDTSGPVCQTPWRPGLPCSLRPEGPPATLSTSTSERFQVERAGSPAGISLTTLSY